jgi:hypothetical protein
MKLLELIRQMFQNLASLSEDELATMRADIIKCAAEFKGADTDENVAALVELGEIADAVKSRTEEVRAAKAEAAAKAEEARQRINALDESDEKPDGEGGEGTEKTEGDGTEKPDEDEKPDENADADGGESKLPIAAGGKEFRSGAREMARAAKPPSMSPELSNTKGPKATLVASAQSHRKGYGEAFEDRWDLSFEIADRLDSLDRESVTGKSMVASARWRNLYPTSRQLADKWTLDDIKKIDAVTSPQAITASGGVCLPTNVDYSIDTWATADRPLRDGLPAFAVDRGGLIYRRPPAVGTLAGATVVWTNANDITPTDPTVKPVQQITCATPDQVFISAIPTRLGFGNLMGQFDPETIAANTDTAIAAAARIAELAELTTIQTVATSVTSAAVLGAARDFFTTLIQTAAAFRFTNRLNRDQTLTFIAPIWGIDLLKFDRVREQAHNDSGTNVFAITDEEVNAWLKTYNINAIWTLDGLAADAGGGTYVAQTFGAFTGGDPVPLWPTELMWNLFIEGSIQFLDGGRLDLGVVRDATLDATNDYETFVEPFENVAWRGFDGGCVQVVSTLVPTGSSSAPIVVS